MCQYVQMEAHFQLFRLDWETHQRLTAVAYKAQGGGSAPRFKQYRLWSPLTVLSNSSADNHCAVCATSFHLTIFMVKTFYVFFQDL